MTPTPTSNRWQSLGAVRVGTLLFPPAGLLLLWRSSQISLARKVFGTLGIVFYSIIYTAMVVFLLCRFCGLQYEFRGGLVPRFTFHKTLPDYRALEANRAQQKQSPFAPATSSVPSNPPITAASWPAFRARTAMESHPITGFSQRGQPPDCALFGASQAEAAMHRSR